MCALLDVTFAYKFHTLKLLGKEVVNEMISIFYFILYTTDIYKMQCM